VTDVVDGDKIEAIVGVPRDPYEHWGKAVSAEQRVYILHSIVCLGINSDLRNCPFSRALDDGIDLTRWVEDVPVRLRIEDPEGEAWLVPKT
jgi:hypothetical protein